MPSPVSLTLSSTHRRAAAGGADGAARRVCRERCRAGCPAPAPCGRGRRGPARRRRGRWSGHPWRCIVPGACGGGVDELDGGGRCGVARAPSSARATALMSSASRRSRPVVPRRTPRVSASRGRMPSSRASRWASMVASGVRISWARSASIRRRVASVASSRWASWLKVVGELVELAPSPDRAPGRRSGRPRSGAESAKRSMERCTRRLKYHVTASARTTDESARAMR